VIAGLATSRNRRSDIILVEYRGKNALGRYVTESWECRYPTSQGEPMEWKRARVLISADFAVEQGARLLQQQRQESERWLQEQLGDLERLLQQKSRR
jgi:hypothetical protein